MVLREYALFFPVTFASRLLPLNRCFKSLFLEFTGKGDALGV